MKYYRSDGFDSVVCIALEQRYRYQIMRLDREFLLVSK